MATRQRVPVGGNDPSGEHVGTCLTATQETSKAGNPMVVWSFLLESGEHLRRWTLLRSTAIHETVVALGLDPNATRLSDAPGRKCRLTVSHDGTFASIEATKPLQ